MILTRKIPELYTIFSRFFGGRGVGHVPPPLLVSYAYAYSGPFPSSSLLFCHVTVIRVSGCALSIWIWVFAVQLRKSNLVHFSLIKDWHPVAPFLLIFLRINRPQCMYFFLIVFLCFFSPLTFWVSDTTSWIFGVSGYPRHPQWLRHWELLHSILCLSSWYLPFSPKPTFQWLPVKSYSCEFVSCHVIGLPIPTRTYHNHTIPRIRPG